MSDIKEKVYGLLLELFPDCPYFKFYNTIKECDDKFKLECFIRFTSCYSNKFMIWTILSEIFPAQIYNEEKHCFWKKITQDANLGWHVSYSNYKKDVFDERELKKDIWEAILSLLEAIKSHPDRDKMKYVWGEK